MRPSFRFIGVLFVGWVLTGSGCAREGPLSSDPKIATRQANELIPKGTSEARAKKILTGRGFELSRLNSESAANYLLVGTQTKQKKTWQVGAIIINGQVVACSVTISDSM